VTNALVHRKPTGHVPRSIGEPLALDVPRRARDDQEKSAPTATPHGCCSYPKPHGVKRHPPRMQVCRSP
jgi:hypothetical protein